MVKPPFEMVIPRFEVGEQVRISGGPFTSFHGVVEEIDDDRSRMKVAISIFGVTKSIEFDFEQVELVD